MPGAISGVIARAARAVKSAPGSVLARLCTGPARYWPHAVLGCDVTLRVALPADDALLPIVSDIDGLVTIPTKNIRQ
jgi:hypothetical protein